MSNAKLQCTPHVTACGGAGLSRRGFECIRGTVLGYNQEVRALQGALYVYEAFVSPGLKKASEKAHTVPAIKKVLDAIDNFTVRDAL